MMEEPMAAAPPTGYRKVVIARDALNKTKAVSDQDGTAIELVPAGSLGSQDLAIELAVSNVDAFKAL